MTHLNPHPGQALGQRGITRREALKRLGIGSVGLLGAGALLAACGDDPDVTDDVADGDTPNGSPSERLLIGGIFSLSGPLAPYGQLIQNGLALGIEQVNQQGGVLGAQVELISEDGASSPDTGLQRARKLVEQDNVHVLFGAEGSDIRNSVVPYASDQSVPMLYPANYEGGHYDDFLFAFNMVPSQEFSDEFFEAILAQANDGRRWFHIGSDFSYAQRTGVWVNQQAEKFDIEIIGDEYIPFGAGDLSAWVARIRDARPDVLANNVVGEDAINLQRLLAQEGLADQMVIAGSAYDQSIAAGMGASGNGGFRALNWNRDVPGEANQEFVDAFDAEHGADSVISYMAETSYGVPFFLKAAYEQVGDLSGEGLVGALPGTSLELPSGRVTVRDDHHVDLSVHLFQIQQGSLALVESFGQVSPGIDQREEGAF